MRIARFLVIAVAALGLAMTLNGCGALRMSYNNGETLSYWWLNNYVDFEREQQVLVRPQIDQLFAWHRTTQLPDYAQLMATGQRQLQAEITPALVALQYDGVRKRTLLLLDQALPALADLALSLSPEQITRIEKKFASDTESYRKDYLRGDIDDRQQFRFKKVMKQAEHWFGNFSRDQEAQIRRASDARPLNNELVLADRVQRQRVLIVLLKKIHAEKPPRELTVRWLKDYTRLHYEHIGNEQQAFFDSATEATIRLTADLINLTTPKQKAHALAQLRDWQKTFSEMAANPASVPLR